MKVSTFSKCCSATVVEIFESKECNHLATVDYLARETEGKFYAGWYFVPDEVKNRKIDFFTAGRVESKSKSDGLVDGIRIYVK